MHSGLRPTPYPLITLLNLFVILQNNAREGWEAAQRKPDSLTRQGHAQMKYRILIYWFVYEKKPDE